MTKSLSQSGTKVGRGRRTLGQLWQVPTFLLGLLAFIGAAASAPWRIAAHEREFDHLVRTLREGLERNESGDVLVAHAESARLLLAQHTGRSAELHFLIGSAYYRQAKQKPAAYGKQVWPIVIDHLSKAQRGIADDDKAALQFRLGFALFQQNTDVSHAIELMTVGVEKGTEHPLTGYRLLADAHLKRTPPDVDAALSALRRVLDLTPEREVETIAATRLQQSELLLRKGQRAEAIKELDRIGAKVSQPLRIRARLLQARACEEDEQWAKAIPIWKELLGASSQVEGGRARVLYALGRCHEHAGDHAAAAAVWAQALPLGGSHGQAAGLRLGQLRLDAGEAGQALADWKTALANVNDVKDYRNPHVEMKQLHEWFIQAIRRFDDMRDPEKSQATAELLRKIAPAGVAEGLVAEAAEALAVQLAEKLKLTIDNVRPADVQAQYRRAGQAYELAAKARAEAERPEALWRSAQCYMRAKETTLAQQVMLQFVKLEPKEERLAEGWQTLGDLYRLDGKKTEARQAYVKCIEYPNSPFAYRARYFLAVAEYDARNFEKARQIIDQNLAITIDIERTWQEKSQFLMASVVLDSAIKINQDAKDAEDRARKAQTGALLAEAQAFMKDSERKKGQAQSLFSEAQVHLKDCILQFPENPNVPKARLQLGECYRELAKGQRAKEIEIQRSIKPLMPEEQGRILDENMRRHRQARYDILREALKTYQQLADELGGRAGAKPLTADESMVLRRAVLGIGETHLDGDQYDEALLAFRSLQVKHRRTVEGLFACPLICHVLAEMQFQQLPKEKVEFVRETALASVRLLVEDLKALPADHEIFRMDGVPPRDGWLRWADDTQRKLTAPPRSDSGLPAIR